jgi:hypothetical protein
MFCLWPSHMMQASTLLDVPGDRGAKKRRQTSSMILFAQKNVFAVLEY